MRVTATWSSSLATPLRNGSPPTAPPRPRPLIYRGRGGLEAPGRPHAPTGRLRTRPGAGSADRRADAEGAGGRVRRRPRGRDLPRRRHRGLVPAAQCSTGSELLAPAPTDPFPSRSGCGRSGDCRPDGRAPSGVGRAVGRPLRGLILRRGGSLTPPAVPCAARPSGPQAARTGSTTRWTATRQPCGEPPARTTRLHSRSSRSPRRIPRLRNRTVPPSEA